MRAPVIDTDKLPPTQYLFLEVMAARHRLGEPYWTFPTRCLAAARALQEAGLVWLRSGPVEKHFQAWFTNEGRAAALSATYVPPIERDNNRDVPQESAGEPSTTVKGQL